MIDPNAPAYPNARAYACGPIDGMTIRADMAKTLMAGMFAAGELRPNEGENAAHWAVMATDALIAELNKTEVKP